MTEQIEKVIKASASITVARIVTMICSVITVPLILRTLGEEEYGLWILLISLTGYLGLSNLGITYSLKNKVAYLFAESKKKEISNFISACFIFYSIIFVSLLGLLYLLIYTNLFPINFLLSNDIVFADKARIAFIIIITFYLFNLFVAGIIHNSFHGLQEISRLNFVNAIYSVISSGVFIFYLITRPSLIGIVLFQGFSQIVQIVILFIILKKKFNWLKLSIRISNLKYMKYIKASSFYFFTGSILTTIITSTDNIVISHYLGVSSVFIYAISFKLFLIPQSAFPIATASWPIISTMYQKKETNKLKDFYSKVLRLNILSKLPLFIIALIFSKEIISFWVGSEVFYGYSLVIIFFLTWILWVWNGSNMVFINAMSLHKSVQLPLLFEATINIVISILLVKYTTLGIVGIALGTLIGQVFIAAYFVPKILTKHIEVKPFKEVTNLLISLLIPFSLLLGCKYSIDYFFTGLFIRYSFYIASVIMYLILLYFIVLRVAERIILKEKIIKIPKIVGKLRKSHTEVL